MELFALLFLGVIVIGSAVLGCWWLMASAGMTLAQLLFWVGLGTGLLTGLSAWIAPLNPFVLLAWMGEPAMNAAKIALPFVILLAAAVAHYIGL